MAFVPPARRLLRVRDLADARYAAALVVDDLAAATGKPTEEETMVIIAGHMLVEAGERDAYVDAFRGLVERARAFDGCIALAITADSVDPRRVNNLEVWESADALDAWREVANPPDTGIEPSGGAMKRYDAEDGGPLF